MIGRKMNILNLTQTFPWQHLEKTWLWKWPTKNAPKQSFSDTYLTRSVRLKRVDYERLSKRRQDNQSMHLSCLLSLKEKLMPSVWGEPHGILSSSKPSKLSIMALWYQILASPRSTEPRSGLARLCFEAIGIKAQYLMSKQKTLFDHTNYPPEYNTAIQDVWLDFLRDLRATAVQ